MCNYLHLDSRAIKPEGFGWKLFVSETSMTLYPYTIDKDNWIRWNKDYCTKLTNGGRGFCFCLRKSEALRLAKVWTERSSVDKVEVARIQYKGGLGRHDEPHICSGYSFDTAICLSFKRVREVPVIVVNFFLRK